MARKVTNKELTLNNHKTILQANELSRSIYSCSMIARKLIAFATSKIQDKQVDEINFFKGEVVGQRIAPCAEFKISDVIKTLNLTLCKENYGLIKKATRELRNANIEIQFGSDDEFKIWNWFESISYSKIKNKIEMEFNKDIAKALLELKKNYCTLNLKTVGEFKSFYAFRYYEIAMSYKGLSGKQGNTPGCWWFKMTPEEIRKVFNISADSYQGRYGKANMFRKVIEEPIEEVNTICDNLHIDIVKIKDGRDVVEYQFNCSSVEQAKIIKKTDSEETKKLARQINAEQDEILHYRKRYPEEFEKAFSECYAQRKFNMAKQFFEYQAVIKLKELGLD